MLVSLNGASGGLVFPLLCPSPLLIKTISEFGNCGRLEHHLRSGNSI